MILLMGASGYIGSYLFKRFSEEDVSVIGTYNQNRVEGAVRFDLGSDSLEFFSKDKLTHVIFSAASFPKPDISLQHWNDSYPVNVTKTREAINYCFENGIIPVYFSTDNVFDGIKGDYKETDTTNPVNCYGKMKCEIERILLDSDKPFLLLRMGKTFRTDAPDPTLFTNMKSGDKLKLATDQIFTPLYLEDLHSFLKLALSNEYTGIFHLSSMFPVTRYDIAVTARDFFGIKDVEITPCSIDSLGLAEKRPKLIDLNSEKFQSVTGKMQEGIEHFLMMVK